MNLPSGAFGAPPGYFMADEEITELQHDDELYLIDQIRRCGTLFYESELPSPYWRMPSESHPDISGPLPVKVTSYIPIEEPEEESGLDKVDIIFHLLRKRGHKPSMQQCIACWKDIGVVISPKPMPLRLQLEHTCDRCREYMRCGIIMIEIKDGGDINSRGSGWCVINEAGILKVFSNDPDTARAAFKERGVFVTSTDWIRMGLPRSKFGELPKEFQPWI